jgi:hypothetical protein
MHVCGRMVENLLYYDNVNKGVLVQILRSELGEIKYHKVLKNKSHLGGASKD